MIMVKFYLEDLLVLVLNIKDALQNKLREQDLWDLFHFVNNNVARNSYIFYFLFFHNDNNLKILYNSNYKGCDICEGYFFKRCKEARKEK